MARRSGRAVEQGEKTMQVQSYLFLEGRCEEALEFYKTALGAEIGDLMRFSDAPGPANPDMPMPPGSDGKIMHCSFKVGDTTIMASDGMCGGKPVFQGCSLAITGIDVATAERLYQALGEGGQVQMPLEQTFFAARFGIVADRFGVSWMLVADA
jgi:PhnB protein